jgi:Xaa-Pro aminopeptidase
MRHGAARNAIRPGSWKPKSGRHHGTMMKLGNGYPGIAPCSAAARSGTHHSPPSRRQIQQGDLVFVDFCGCYDRYHVNVNRTFSLAARSALDRSS